MWQFFLKKIIFLSLQCVTLPLAYILTIATHNTSIHGHDEGSSQGATPTYTERTSPRQRTRIATETTILSGPGCSIFTTHLHGDSPLQSMSKQTGHTPPSPHSTRTTSSCCRNQPTNPGKEKYRQTGRRTPAPRLPMWSNWVRVPAHWRCHHAMV